MEVSYHFVNQSGYSFDTVGPWGRVSNEVPRGHPHWRVSEAGTHQQPLTGLPWGQVAPILWPCSPSTATFQNPIPPQDSFTLNFQQSFGMPHRKDGGSVGSPKGFPPLQGF